MNIGVKKLTKQQKQKADKVVKLLLELQESGVWPISIDGGGGGGLQFVRCKKEDMWDFGDIILDGSYEDREELEYEYIYSPEEYHNVKLEILAP